MPTGVAFIDVIEEITAERRRQKMVEGWTLEHDDEHAQGEMARAAGVYALMTTDLGREATYVHGRWIDLLDQYRPWDRSWWKPTTPRRNLIKAAALIVAEIERLDRAEKREAA